MTHASFSVTDLQAIRGDYLLHPFSGFVPGYDMVGVVEQTPSTNRSELRVGQVVAAALPVMGAHTSHVLVHPSLLVAVPDNLNPAVPATVPLDALTARFALDQLQPALNDKHPSLLVQGATGAVGCWAVQMGRAEGLKVIGTGSPTNMDSRIHADTTLLSYEDPEWTHAVTAMTDGGVNGAIDHTGSVQVRDAVRPHGRIVHTAFGGAPGAQRSSTFRGGVSASFRQRAPVREFVCSTPLTVALRRAMYRRALSTILTDVADGYLLAPRPDVYAFEQYDHAYRAAAATSRGTKLVLELPGG